MQAKYIGFLKTVYRPISGCIWLLRKVPLRCLRLKILESAFFLYIERLRFEARNIPEESAHATHCRPASLRLSMLYACGECSKLDVLWLQAHAMFSRMSQKSSKADIPSGCSKDGAKCREYQIAKAMVSSEERSEAIVDGEDSVGA